MAPLRVSPQAIPTRLAGLPAAVRGQLWAEVWTRLQAPPPPPLPHPSWARVRAAWPLIALVDGSPLEALRQKPPLLRQQEGLVLAGTGMVMVAACRHRPLGHLYTAAALANDKRFAAALLAALPVGGRVIFDLGCVSCLWFDDCTTTPRFFVTRLREKIASRPGQGLSPGPY